MLIPNLEIDNEGNVKTLYNEEIDLYGIGLISNVKRASNIVFDETTQEWIVVRASDGKEVLRNKNRANAIDSEIAAFGPGGTCYDE